MKRILKWLVLALLFPCLGRGEIVFHEVSVPLYAHEATYLVDMDSNGVDDFRIHNLRFDVGSTFNINVLNPEVSDGLISETLGGLDHATAYSAGAMIGPEIEVEHWRNIPAALNGSTVGEKYGQFFQTNAYVGVSFLIGANRHYGWINIDNDIGFTGGRLDGFAYETEPNTVIVAGTIPEPGSVAMLVAGSAGIWLARKKRFRPGRDRFCIDATTFRAMNKPPEPPFTDTL